MKKKLIFILACVVLLTSCNSKKYTEGIETEAAKKEVEDTGYVSTLKTNGFLCASAKGYYFMPENTVGPSQIGKKIPFWNYYDIELCTCIPLCSKVNCDHGTIDGCEAIFYDYLADAKETGGIYDHRHISNFVYYQGRLFRISYDEKNGTRLVSYDLSGNDMVVERIVEPDANCRPLDVAGKINDSTFTIHKGYLYMYLYTIKDDGSTEHKYIKAKLGSKDAYEVLLDYKTTSTMKGISGVRVVEDNDNIYMYRPLGGRNKVFYNFAIYSYNVNTNELKEEFNSKESWNDSLFVEPIREQQEGIQYGETDIYSDFFHVSGNDIYIYGHYYEQAVMYHLDLITGKMEILDLPDENKYINGKIVRRQTSNKDVGKRMIVDENYIYYLSPYPSLDRDDPEYIQYFTEKYLNGEDYKNRSTSILYVYDRKTLEAVYKFEGSFLNKSMCNIDLDDLYKNNTEKFNEAVVSCYTDGGYQSIMRIEGVDDRYLIITVNDGYKYMALDKSTIGSGSEIWKCIYTLEDEGKQ